MPNEHTDWAEWSQQAVALMEARNQAWRAKFAVGDVQYQWDLDRAEITFGDQVVARICVVGTTSAEEGTFLWSWANDWIPAAAKRGIEKVRDFGESNGLPLLTEPSLRGARPEALEVAAISGRILDADGGFFDSSIYFTLHELRSLAP